MDRRRCAVAVVAAALCAVPAVASGAPPLIDQVADGTESASLDYDATFIPRTTRRVSMTLEAAGEWTKAGVVEPVSVDADARVWIRCGLLTRSRTMRTTAVMALPNGARRCTIAVRASAMQPFQLNISEQRTSLHFTAVRG